MKNLLKIFAVMLFAAIASFFIACSEDCPTCPEDIPDPVFDINGAWSGIFETGGTISLSLSKDANNGVTGTGLIQYGSLNEALTVPSGSITNNQTISLTISIVGYQPFIYQGTVTAVDVHKGMINGSGFSNERITFTQP